MHQSFMRNMWESRSFSDLSLTCCDGSVQAHRCVISAASPVFARMLGSDRKEAQTEVVEIVDSSACTVEAALCFIYTGQVPEDAKFDKLISFAHTYEIEELIKFSAKALSNDVSVENVDTVVASLRQLTNHKEVEASFQDVLREIQADTALLEAMARNINCLPNCLISYIRQRRTHRYVL